MLRKMLKTCGRPPIEWFRQYKVNSSIKHLVSHRSPKLKAIGDALDEFLNNTVSAEEQALITLIEQRRSSLLSSEKEIAVIDYGAGNPSSNRTKEEMKKGVRSTALVAKICKNSMPQFWAILLFKLIRKLDPLSCVELGTCVGISASYLSSALKITDKGKIVTLEGSPEISVIANETLDSLKLQNATIVSGPFHETLKGVLESSRPIDFFFNDGHHDHDALIQYYNEALPNLSNEAVIVFDDISWSPGMRKAWLEIEDDPRVVATIDLKKMGIALVGTKLATKEKFRIPLRKNS